MSPQASLEAQSKCGSFLQESNCATFLNQHIESRFIYTSIFFVCMMFTGIPDFSLWLCRQGSTHAQDNRTSLGMFCRGLTQICSQESSPQKIVVNTQWRQTSHCGNKFLTILNHTFSEVLENSSSPIHIGRISLNATISEKAYPLEHVRW